MAYKQEWK